MVHRQLWSENGQVNVLIYFNDHWQFHCVLITNQSLLIGKYLLHELILQITFQVQRWHIQIES